MTKSQPAKLCETFVKNGFRGKNLLPTEPFLYYNLTNSNRRAQMDVVAGKGGNFFVVTGRVNNVILGMLSEISYDEFARYNAYSTMKKISRQSCAEYAAKNGLHERILENFFRLEEVIDYHATQDLMYFIESEDSRDRSDSFDNDVVVDPANYSNGFLHAAPREVSGLVTDSFQIPEELVPRMLKSVGISIKRETLSHFVKWSSVTYKVDIVPARKQSYRSRFDNKSIAVVENCYVFEPDDWKNIKKIEQTFIKEKVKRKKSWFLKEKPDDVLLDDILHKLFKEKELIKYGALYAAYREIRRIRNDYIGSFIHSFHHFRNKILIDNRCLHPKSVALSAQDMYNILVEDERSAAFAVTVYRLSRYWQNGNWNELLSKEPCFAILAERPQEMRDNLLKNMEFVLNVKLKYWTEHELERHYPKFVGLLPALEARNSIAKGEDENRREYLLQRSLMYSFYIYNPDSGKFELHNLSRNIKIDIPADRYIQENIIKKAQYYIDRKRSAKRFLLTKNGISETLVRKAAVIFDAPRRLGVRKRMKNS